MNALQRQVPEALYPLLKPMRYKVARGGRGGAKSHFFAEEVVLRSYTSLTRVACIREVQSSIKESVKQLLTDKIDQFGLRSFFNVLDTEIRGANGSLTIFKGMQDYNAGNIKSLEGYDIAWTEEAQTTSHASLRTLRPTLRKPGSELWFSYNRRHKSDAVDLFFTGPNCPKNATVVDVNWSDNPWFPDTLREEMEHDYRVDPAMAQHVWGGGYEIITTGSYYGKEIAIAENEFRIGEVPYDPAADVFAAWDLGIGDNTAIWIFQRVGMAWHFIDYYSNYGQSLGHYVDWCNARKYKIKEHYLPHDANARELQSGISRVQFLEDRGFICNAPLKAHRVEDGINAVRAILPKSYFNADTTGPGVDCLRMYKAEYDEEKGVQKTKPTHDWASHGADAFRIAAMGGAILNYTRSDWKTPILRNLNLVP